MRWIRLEVSFDDSDWVNDLSPGGQLAWIKLLCTMKRDGSKGTMRAMSPRVAAKKWGVDESDLTAMLAAAVSDSALEIDADMWTVVNWPKYQPADHGNVERQRRHRKKKQETESNGDSNGSNGRNAVTSLLVSRDVDVDVDIHTPRAGEESAEPKKPPPDQLTQKFPDASDRVRIVRFLTACPRARQQGWIARIDAWITGHELPNGLRPTPDQIARALAEYVEEDEAKGRTFDFQPIHVQEFVQRVCKLDRRVARDTRNGSSPPTDRARTLYRLYAQHGFTKNRSEQGHRDALQRLVDDGVITDADQFWRELLAVKPWVWMGTMRATDEALAVRKITEFLDAMPTGVAA